MIKKQYHKMITFSKTNYLKMFNLKIVHYELARSLSLFLSLSINNNHYTNIMFLKTIDLNCLYNLQLNESVIPKVNCIFHWFRIKTGEML